MTTREVETTNPELAKVIEWADRNPVVWKIVTGTRSKAFGRKSSFYIGWAQNSKSPDAILERARAFREEIFTTDYRARQIWGWRACYTFEHYRDKDFKGGFFQQWDEKYPRGCLTLDYTPETLEEVLDQFEKWIGSSYNSVRITIDGKTVRTLADQKIAAMGGKNAPSNLAMHLSCCEV